MLRGLDKFPRASQLIRGFKTAVRSHVILTSFWEPVSWGTGLEIGRLYPGWRVCSGRVRREGSRAFGGALAPSGGNIKISRTKECLVPEFSDHVCTQDARAHTKKGTEWAVGNGDWKERSTGREESFWSHLPIRVCPPFPSPPILLQTTLPSLNPRMSRSS